MLLYCCAVNIPLIEKENKNRKTVAYSKLKTKLICENILKEWKIYVRESNA